MRVGTERSTTSRMTLPAREFVAAWFDMPRWVRLPISLAGIFAYNWIMILWTTSYRTRSTVSVSETTTTYPGIGNWAIFVASIWMLDRWTSSRARHQARQRRTAKVLAFLRSPHVPHRGIPG